MAYEGMKAKLKHIPNTIRDQDIDFNSRVYREDFKNSIGYEEVTVNHSIETYPVQIVRNGKDPTVKKVLMYPGKDISSGDFITRSDLTEWLCNALDMNPIYKSGIIEKCNQFLKWIDDKGTIKSFPAVFNATISSGIDEGNVITLPDGKRQLIVQKNADTSKLRRGLRFIFDKEVFIITDYDAVSKEGLIQLSLKSDLYNPATDNMELGIADYTRISSPEIILLDASELSMKVGQTEQIDLRVANKYGEVSETVTFYSTDESVATVSPTGLVSVIGGGEAIIKMSIPSGYKTQISIHSVEETAPDPEPIVNNRSEIEGQDKIVYGRKASYTLKFYANNVLTPKPCLFSLSDISGNATTMATIASQISSSSSCVVQAISWSGRQANVILTAKDTDGNVLAKKTITISNA